MDNDTAKNKLQTGFGKRRSFQSSPHDAGDTRESEILKLTPPLGETLALGGLSAAPALKNYSTVNWLLQTFKPSASRT